MENILEYTPFVLRFSGSMIRENPRKFKGGKIRSANGAKINISRITHNIQSGLKYYKSFEYNDKMPTFCSLQMKKNSLSKSLRYPILATGLIDIVASLSAANLVFSIKNFSDFQRFASLMQHSRGNNFQASVTHISDIFCIMPEDKHVYTAGRGETKQLLIKMFPHEKSDDILNFFNYGLNIPSTYSTTKANLLISDLNPTLDISKILTHAMVKSVEPMPEIFIYEQYMRHEDLDVSCIEPRDLNRQYPTAGLIDSGVSDSSFLKEWELAKESFIDPIMQNNTHGTFVCGRMLKNGESFGGITYLNAEIIAGSGQLNAELFIRKLTEIIKKYHKMIKIYNISLGTNISVADEFSSLSHAMDRLQYDYDVLFILSTGNKPITGETVERITSPAESIHGITVGSVAHLDTNAQKRLSPSFFTRQGPAPAMFRKPDICSFGGAHEMRFGKLRPVGVYSIGVRNELAEDCGTSHAAPLITAKAAKLYHKYSHAYKSPDMTKALIINDAFITNENRKHSDIIGYGIYDESEIEQKHATYLHSGKCKYDKIVEMSNIPVPEAIFTKGKAYGEIILTLVYKTITDINFPLYYCMQKLDLSLGYYKDEKWHSIITEADVTGSKKNEAASWQPLKVYYKKMSGRELPHDLVLRLTPSHRDFCRHKKDIPYSLVINFVRKGENIYANMMANHDKYVEILDKASELWKTC